MRQIVAIGGLASLTADGTRQIHHYLLRLSAKPRPKVCFLPTASGEAADRIIGFYEAYSPLPCEPSWLSLFKPPTNDLKDFLLNKDVVFVAGGNTRSMLALWREWKLDAILRRAYEMGIVLAGSSAGANCWFEQCTTDSIPGELRVLDCLGFLPGSFTPHYDVEPGRRPALHSMLIGGEIQSGYAANNDTALRFVDGRLEEAVSTRDAATAYRVHAQDDTVIEDALEMKRL